MAGPVTQSGSTTATIATLRGVARLVVCSGVWRHLLHAGPAGLLRAWRGDRGGAGGHGHRDGHRRGGGPDRMVAIMAAWRGKAEALRDADAPADAAMVGDAGARWTWRALDREIDQWCAALHAAGVAPGDRVAIAIETGAALLIAQLAAARANAIAMPLSCQLKVGELRGALAVGAPRLAIVEEAVRETWTQAVNDMPGGAGRQGVQVVGLVAWRDAVRGAASTQPRAPRRLSTGTGGVILFTSGTTGPAKGAHRRWDGAGYAAAIDLMNRLGARADDRQLVACPMYHAAAPSFAQMTLALGGSCVIMRRWDARHALALIARHRITCMFVVPTMLQQLLDQLERMEGATPPTLPTLPSLRWIVSGAAPLPPPLAERALEVLGPRLWNFYGATETGVVSLASPQELRARPGTIGRPLAGVSVGIAAPIGEVGELHVTSAQAIEGYWNNGVATAAGRRGAAWTVGDLGCMDGDGYLYLVGRARDVIIRGGAKIYPQELEDALAGHPGVAEAAVIGEPDPEWGERVVAVVVARAGAEVTAADVTQWCRDRLADFKRPRRVEFVAAMPRNRLGKVDKAALRAGLGEHAADRPSGPHE